MSWEDEATLVTVKPDNGALLVEYDGSSVTCAGTLWQEPVDQALTLWCDVPESFESVLREEGDRWHAIQVNPGAALLKAIRGAGFAPTSPEFDVEHEGTWYVAQRAEHLLTGEVRYYYAPYGRWDRVDYAR